MTDSNDLLPLLRERLLGMYSPLLAGTRATMLFTAGGMANWTVEIEDVRANARRGGPPRPTTSVRAPLPVLTEVVSGKRSGVQAFLVGNSLGGRTALEAALNSPFEVRGLVLLCPAVAFRRLRQLVPFVRVLPDEIAALPLPVPRRMAMRGLR